MNPAIPTPPELLGVWRASILETLASQGIDADVGVKRPASVANRSRPFVRVMCLGGPWRWVQMWYPRLAAETWASDVATAHRIDAQVARATLDLAGHEQAQEVKQGLTRPSFYICESALDTQGADSAVDGVPVILTQALLCVQVTPIHRKENQ